VRSRACGTRHRTNRPCVGARVLSVVGWLLVASAPGCTRGGESRGEPIPSLESATAGPALESGPADGDSLSVVSITCGDTYDLRTERLTHVTAELTSSTDAVYVVARLRNVPDPGELVGRWEHLDSGTCLAQKALTLNGPDVEARFSLTRPTKGWPAGRYKFYLSANGEDVAGIEFRVPGEAPGRAGAAKGGGV